MYSRPAAALCLFAVSVACVGGQSERSGILQEGEPASDPAATPPVVAAAPAIAAPLAIAARAPSDEFGEVVDHLGDAHWYVFQDSKLNHWFGSEGQGAFRVDGERIVRFTTRDGLAHDCVREIQEDASGNLLFSTHGGISKFDGRRFETLTPVQAGTSGWRLEPGDLWLMGPSKDGVCRYDGKTLFALEFPKVPLEDAFHAKFPRVPYSPYAAYVIRRDSRGAVWFGTAVLGVCRYDGRAFTWITEDELTELHDGPSFGVRGIIEDRDGKFWLSNLLHRYDGYPRDAAADAGGVSSSPQYRREPGLVSTDPNDDVGNAYFMSGLTDRSGVSWTATYGAGVWRIDGKSLTHVPVLVAGRQIHLFSIYEDRQGVLWLGTQAHGAWRFDGEKFERFEP